MLDTLRKASKTFVAKLLLILLVASFGIWGVSSSIVNDNSSAVVTVGDQEVSAQEFQLAYQRQISDLSRQFGMRISAEQARAFGIDQQIYAQLAAGAALDQLADDMKLGLSKDRLASLIAEDPAFRAVNGQFDRQLFTQRLRNAGLREDDYILERSKVAVRSQIVDAISDGFTPPQVLTDALKHYRDEARSVDYLLLTYANIDPVKAPTDDVLAEWFEGRKNRYRAPEYRTFSYVKLEPSDIADASGISEDDMRAEFERRKDSYRKAETRTIEQLTFPNKEMADAAALELRKGDVTFDRLVSDQGKTSADVLLGDFTRDGMPDPTIAEAAFAVSTDGGTTPVVEGIFGPAIIRVTNIRPESARSFEEAQEEIRKDLAETAAVEEVHSIHDRYEDLRGGGSTLEEAAQQLNLTAVTVNGIDAAGKDEEGEEVKSLPAAQALVAEVFKTEVGQEALPVNVGQAGYVWFDVKDVTPERDRTLDEAREAVLADWTAEQQRETLAALAATLEDRIQKGATIADIAGELGIAVETKAGVRRLADDPVLGPNGVAAAFSGPLGTVAEAEGADRQSRILLVVTDVSDQPTFDALEDQNQQIAAIAAAAGDDILDQMVGRLQAEYGVTINRTLAEQAMVLQ
ncbi:SurA N-terminal domain-containing protein [Rhizobiaceae bacterium BDR2-2]|uniref:Parvulin-like PPIase n=1 Tax=Ectorhizobium quercum TaxID=2965071 RepID=A0AAE3SW96_9HYPH|nr:peptidylprolyl isomerase [Ectorhizobium quercum]MCX8997779.1 SurA N-terminal domain-containing protein [Ectorhizobium quercum]